MLDNLLCAVSGELMKRILYVTLAMLILALPGSVLFNACSASNPGVADKAEANAAIIDQLSVLNSNGAYSSQLTRFLENYGFKVDLYQGDDITVDFYRKLPTLGYKLIIFRSHSSMQTGTLHSSSGDRPVVRTYLFTNEPNSLTSQIGDQLSNRLAKARIDETFPWVFGISPDFVTHSMQGSFDHTVVIIMGCYASYVNDLAQSFIEKGASAYMGWDACVGLDYVDTATITLVENLLSNKVSLDAAVKATMQEKGADPNWGARLKYYPPQSGNQTIAELSISNRRPVSEIR